MENFNQIITSDIPVIVDFYAEWCAPCKQMAPVLKEVKDHFSDKIRIIKIDVDKNEHISAQYGIMSVPTLLVFKSGNILWKQSGVISAQNLNHVIEKYL